MGLGLSYVLGNFHKFLANLVKYWPWKDENFQEKRKNVGVVVGEKIKLGVGVVFII